MPRASPPHRPRAYADCVLFEVILPRLTNRQRKAFYRAMVARARELGVLVVRRGDLWLMFGAEHVCTHSQRTMLTRWLEVNPHHIRFRFFRPQRLRDLLRSGQLPETDAADGLPRHSEETLRARIQYLAAMMISQWQRYMWGAVR